MPGAGAAPATAKVVQLIERIADLPDQDDIRIAEKISLKTAAGRVGGRSTAVINSANRMTSAKAGIISKTILQDGTIIPGWGRGKTCRVLVVRYSTFHSKRSRQIRKTLYPYRLDVTIQV